MQWYTDLMLNNPDWSAIFAPQGRMLREGEMIRRTNLARTLASIAQEGADALYQVVSDVNFLIFTQAVSDIGPYCRFPRPQSPVNWGNTLPFRFNQVFCQGRPRITGHLSW